MNNGLFKSYTKKIIKSEAFISVIVVMVLATCIIGTSYALYMDVDTDTDYQLINVGDLAISFVNGENTITLNNMTPTEDSIALSKNDNIFSFYIYNTGNYTTDYNIKLVTLEGNEIDTQYINYQICINNNNNCEDVATLSNITDSIILKDELNKKKSNEATNPSVYYFIRVWVNSSYSMPTVNKAIKLKVVVDAKNANGNLDTKNTLSGSLLNNENIAINNVSPNFNEAENNEVGIYKALDDYGTSYYFRGSSSYNYVKFAGFIWRVVRINGDGSIRLILDGVTNRVKQEGSVSYSGSESAFNVSNSDNAYIGYMYGTAGSDNYESTHQNVNNSTIKTAVDLFYTTYLNSYSSYISDTLFCGDKSLADISVGTNNTGLGYGTNITYYNLSTKYKREYLNTLENPIVKPNLKCSPNANDDYSRYSVQVQTLNNGKTTNGNLAYPIGLLSADELVMAGADVLNNTLTSFYLFNSETVTSYQLWYTMSPIFTDNINEAVSRVFASNQSTSLSHLGTSYVAGVRPVINLNKDVLISSGNGTKTTPYIIK